MAVGGSGLLTSMLGVSCAGSKLVRSYCQRPGRMRTTNASRSDSLLKGWGSWGVCVRVCSPVAEWRLVVWCWWRFQSPGSLATRWEVLGEHTHNNRAGERRQQYRQGQGNIRNLKSKGRSGYRGWRECRYQTGPSSESQFGAGRQTGRLLVLALQKI